LQKARQFISQARPQLRAVRDNLWIGLFAFTSTAVTGVISLALTRGLSHLGPIWWSNGVLLAIALASPRRRWPLLMLTGGLGILAAHLLVLGIRADFLWFTACNLLEVWLAAWLLEHYVGTPFDLTGPKQLWRFVVIAVLLTPLISGLFAGLLAHLANRVPWAVAISQWSFADALGIATATPVTLALYRGYAQNIRRQHKLNRTLALLLLLGAVTTLGFLQQDGPLLFLLFPLLLVVVVQLGWIGGGIGVCMITLIASTLTALGHGPIASLAGITMTVRTYDLQIFFASTSFSATIVATIFEERQKLLRLATENERRFRSLAENSPDVLVLSNLTGQRLYVSPAVESLFGWSPRELLGRSFHIDVVHPDDVALLGEVLAEVLRSDEGRTLTYRCQRKDGQYIWVEASINLYRDSATHQPVGFVNVVRDITRRKAAEERLHNAYLELETLAAIDPLTGIANRRRFDMVLDAEWKRSMRTGSPVALLLIDVDYFKNFNDLYGHLRGDTCLRELADCLTDCVRKVSDVVARFGGEEFAIVLPDTEEAGALDLAERIRTTLAERAIAHEGNPARMVTISVGCASVIPHRACSSLLLLEVADKALYSAKGAGRNRVICASGLRERTGATIS
jgi:diguanylate cyclase (GGDEF)-like protein/PAS domain S-box-containing protein